MSSPLLENCEIYVALRSFRYSKKSWGNYPPHAGNYPPKGDLETVVRYVSEIPDFQGLGVQLRSNVQYLTCNGYGTVIVSCFGSVTHNLENAGFYKIRVRLSKIQVNFKF
jgi:hypothetical protein